MSNTIGLYTITELPKSAISSYNPSMGEKLSTESSYSFERQHVINPARSFVRSDGASVLVNAFVANGYPDEMPDGDIDYLQQRYREIQAANETRDTRAVVDEQSGIAQITVDTSFRRRLSSLWNRYATARRRD